jgi:hypothetical protein
MPLHGRSFVFKPIVLRPVIDNAPVVKSDTDNVTVQFTETSTIVVAISSSDSISIQFTETATLLVIISTTDTIQINFTETNTLLVIVVSIDYLTAYGWRYIGGLNETDYTALVSAELIAERLLIGQALFVTNLYKLLVSETNTVAAFDETVVSGGNFPSNAEMVILGWEAVGTLGITSTPTLLKFTTETDSISVSFTEISATTVIVSDTESVSVQLSEGAGTVTVVLIAFSSADSISVTLTDSTGTVTVVASIVDYYRNYLEDVEGAPESPSIEVPDAGSEDDLTEYLRPYLVD